MNQIEEATGLEGSLLPALRELDLHGNLLASTAGINVPHLEKLYVVSHMGLHVCSTVSLRWSVSEYASLAQQCSCAIGTKVMLKCVCMYVCINSLLPLYYVRM